VSIINQASVEWLEWVSAMTLSGLRFRGNLYVSGLEPWEEFSLTGKTVRIGKTRLKLLRPALRCAATSADPWTGDTSIEVPGMMRHYLGHMFCGIYAKVLEGGDIFEGDHLRVVEDEPFNPHVPCRPMRRTRYCGRAWRSCSDQQTASTCCRAMTAGRFCQPMPEPASSCIRGWITWEIRCAVACAPPQRRTACH
jgi:hypothetical protein